MKHVKNRADAEFETERQKLSRQKDRPKRQKKAPVDRKMAFDEQELEKYSPQEPVSKTKRAESIKKLIAAAVICVLCGLVVFAYANKDKLTFEAVSNWFNYELLGKSRGEGFPVYINGSDLEYGNIGLIDGKYLSYVSGTTSISIDSKGREIYNRRIPYTRPIMRTSGSYSLIYNLDGTGYQLSTASDVLLDKETDDSIFYGTVAKNGMFAMLTKADGYLSRLSLYSKSGSLRYTYSFSEYYAYCVDINEEASEAVVGAISTRNGEARSVVYLIDFSQEEPKTINTFDNSTVYSVKYLSSGTAAIICDDRFVIYDTVHGTLTETPYGDRVLSEYYINTDTGCTALALSRSGDGRMCDIDYYNNGGEREASISTDLKVDFIDVYKDKIAVLSDGQIYVFNKSGAQLRSINAGSDAKAIRLISEDTAYVVGISEIRMLEFENNRETADESDSGDGS